MVDIACDQIIVLIIISGREFLESFIVYSFSPGDYCRLLCILLMSYKHA